MGHRAARRPGRRPLVADRDRLADRREPARARADADQARLADGAGARVRRPGARPARHAGRGRRARARSASGCRCRPGTLPTLWGDDERYVASYLSAFDGYYLTGDGGYVDEDGYLFVMGRTDDVINVAGHRLSTGLDGGRARRPPGGRRVRGDRRRTTTSRARCRAAWSCSRPGVDIDPDDAARRAGAAGARRDRRRRVVQGRRRGQPALPKTRSGKILRQTMRAIADGKDEPVPSTIEDPGVLDRLRPTLRGEG